MNDRARERRLNVQIDRVMDGPHLPPELRELVEEFRQGGMLCDTSGADVRQFIDYYACIALGYRNSCPVDFHDQVSKMLMTARLPVQLSFAETLLTRCADDPAAAIRHVEERYAQASRQNSQNAKCPRDSRLDWWSKIIDDCIGDDPEALPAQVREYLLQIEGVSYKDGTFRHNTAVPKGELVEPISNKQFHAKIAAAKKRYLRSS